MPGDDRQTAGGYVVNDPVNKLFLIVQRLLARRSPEAAFKCSTKTATSAESLNGFDFTDAGFLVTPIKVAINPARRMG